MQALLNRIEAVSEFEVFGRVKSVKGLSVEIVGPIFTMGVGSRLEIARPHMSSVLCEIVGFTQDSAIALPFGDLIGVQQGAKAFVKSSNYLVYPSSAWLGRVINALGEPLDGKGPLPHGEAAYAIRSAPPPAHERSRVGEPIDLGVKTLNTFLTCCNGQRMGIFAGSGVGKSVLLSMLAKNTACNVSIIGLIGERGREVQEFIEDNLGEEGLAQSIVVVATSDEAALMRRQAAYLTLTLAEYFRDREMNVLCMIDSITRFAMAQREIGLSGGEPPTTRGYTPSVFSELPKLLERAGPGDGKGAVTGLFTVLVEGDDQNEPIADAVRGILDGHIVMERSIAERGRFPAINVLRSVSRTMPQCVDPDYLPVVVRAKQLMSTYADMEELIRLGAYRRGSNPEVDKAINYHPQLEAFLSQLNDEKFTIQQSYAELAQLLNDEIEPNVEFEPNEETELRE
ncbi:MAG: flagellar protein export ATPase FliI [Methyloligellaceae bacterium]